MEMCSGGGTEEAEHAPAVGILQGTETKPRPSLPEGTNATGRIKQTVRVERHMWSTRRHIEDYFLKSSPHPDIWRH